MALTRHPHPLRTGLAAELEQLASAIAEDGVVTHTADIVRLGRAAEDLGLEPGSVAALLDPTSAPIVRERAAVRLSLAADHSAPVRRRITPVIPATAHLRSAGIPTR